MTLSTSLLADCRSLWIKMPPKGYSLYPIWITLSQGKHFFTIVVHLFFSAYPQWYRVTQPCSNTACSNQGGQELKIEFLCVALSSGGFFGGAHLDEKYRVRERWGKGNGGKWGLYWWSATEQPVWSPSFFVPPGGWQKTFSWWHESWMSVCACAWTCVVFIVFLGKLLL